VFEGIGSEGALVNVMGLTFKEDCPDLRNSKVPDIIEELKSYGCKVKVHDPCCDPQEAIKEFNISLCKENELKPADALILAVAHHQFQQWSIDRLRSFLKKGGIFSDVKNMVPRKNLEKYGHRVWRL
jgi:UDP-N-acetyl-D-galactosamine dehydrogenase